MASLFQRMPFSNSPSDNSSTNSGSSGRIYGSRDYKLAMTPEENRSRKSSVASWYDNESAAAADFENLRRSSSAESESNGRVLGSIHYKQSITPEQHRSRQASVVDWYENESAAAAHERLRRVSSPGLKAGRKPSIPYGVRHWQMAENEQRQRASIGN